MVVQSRARIERLVQSGWVRVFVTELKGGTLTSSAAGFAWCLVRPSSGGVERDRVERVAVGTLLGPEGAGRPCCGVGL